MNLDNIKKLLRLLKNSDITEVHYEKDGEKIKLKRGYEQQEQGSEGIQSVAKTGIRGKVTVEERVHEHDSHSLFTVTSPIVGTFYRSPSPDDPAFVEIGSAVRKGQVLCIIEAMKLMNEIECEVDGVLNRVLVENGQPVEYGEPLFLIEPK